MNSNEATLETLRRYRALRVELRQLMTRHESWRQVPAVLEQMSQLREALHAARARQPS